MYSSGGINMSYLDSLKDITFIKNISNLINNNLLVMILLLILLCVLTIVCLGKIFKKANQKSWKLFIPVYNIFIMFKICDMKWTNIFWLIIPSIFTSFVVYLSNLVSLYMLVLLVIPLVCSVYFTFKIHIRLAQKFGKSKWFGVFLLVYPINLVLYCILAFSKKVAYIQNNLGVVNKKEDLKDNVKMDVIVNDKKNIICLRCKKKLCENAIYCTVCEKYIDEE